MIECKFYFLFFVCLFWSIHFHHRLCRELPGSKWSRGNGPSTHKKRKHTDNSIFILSAARFVFLFYSPNSFFDLALLVNFTSWQSHCDSDGHPKRPDVVRMSRCFFWGFFFNPALHWVQQERVRRALQSVAGVNPLSWRNYFKAEERKGEKKT